MKFNPISSSVMALANELSRMFNKGIGADNLANNSVDSVHLKDGIITPVKLIPGLIPASKRQMIWQAKKDYSTDNSIFLSAVIGQLKVTLLASATPFIVTISGGFDKNNGQIDYVFGIDSDVIGAWTLPPNKSFLQLYIEYNPFTKSVSYGYTELETVYLKPSAPSIGQHWFDKGNLMIMQEWDGSAWQKRFRLMVGEAITGASSVTSVIAYAVQCKYDSGWFAAQNNTNYPKNHNIGIYPYICYNMVKTSSGEYPMNAYIVGYSGIDWPYGIKCNQANRNVVNLLYYAPNDDLGSLQSLRTIITLF